MTQDMRQNLSLSPSDVHPRHVNGSSPQSSQKNGISNGTNGANGSSEHRNGLYSPHTNEHSSTKPRPASSFYGHDREEVTRLLMQTLDDLGYGHAADILSEESGFSLESPTIASFRRAILQGDWSKAEDTLLGPPVESNIKDAEKGNGTLYRHQGLPLNGDVDVDQMKFLIREQKYVELLKKNQKGAALMVLQSELQPLNYDTRRLNALSGLLVSEPSDKLDWDAVSRGRDKLLSELSKSISPLAMLPQHRLPDLLDQVHRGQISKCLYHNPTTAKPPSLFVDHMCDERDFPLHISVELSQNEGEVWFVDFSHNGKFLAACGDSRSVLVYETRNFDVQHKLSDHGSPVVYVAWSPDDSKLITCCQDAKARIWDMKTGRCLQVVDHHGQAVTTAAWTPDGQWVVTGSLDKQAQLCIRTSGGLEPFNWPSELRTQDCAITPNGQKLIAMSSERFITVYDLPSRTEEYSIKLAHRMTCVSVSRDSRTMLVNMANDEIHLIDIETADIIRRYAGQQQGDFIIRSTFGGSDEGLIISGSMDSKVYIWHKENGTLIETLEGHSHGCVNSVSWNPRNPSMFASGGDDKKVRIWTKHPQPSTLLRRRVSSQSSHRRSNYDRSL